MSKSKINIYSDAKWRYDKLKFEEEKAFIDDLENRVNLVEQYTAGTDEWISVLDKEDFLRYLDFIKNVRDDFFVRFVERYTLELKIFKIEVKQVE